MSNILEDPLYRRAAFKEACGQAEERYDRCRELINQGNPLARQEAESYYQAAIVLRENARGPVQRLNAILVGIISRRLIKECPTDISLTSTITSPTVIQGER